MPPSQAVKSPAAFLELVRKSGLVTQHALAKHFPSEDELPPTPHEVAAALVAADLLTQYQARQLLAGKYRGFILGPYKVLQLIGRGGMGTVFLAEHGELRRKVAMKVLATDKAQDKLALERFFREARAAAALDHPNIVRLYDISQGGGVHFLVMEYVDGNDLQSLMAKTGPLHYAQAAHYVAQAAAGLQHAHSKGFVHRDIKPANLILGKDGVVKILDMGLTRSVGNAHDNLTEASGEDTAVTGTVDFISPEQALGGAVDERSDVYNLGATLFSLLTGHPPFGGTTTQKLMQHQFQDPQTLAKKLKGKAPATLSDVVLKMMAKKPADRYQTAEDVIDALGPWLPAATSGNVVKDPARTSDLPSAGRPTDAPPTASTTGRRKRLKRPAPPPPRWNRKTIAVAGGILAAVCVLGVVFALTRGSDSSSGNGPDAGQRPAGSVKQLSRFDFATLRPAVEGVRGQVLTSQTLGGQLLPPGWEITHFGGEADADYLIGNVGGSRALGIRHVGGSFGPQVIFMPQEHWNSLNLNDTMTFRLEYRYEGKGMGYAAVQKHTPQYDKYALVELPPTAEWRQIDVRFTRTTGEPFTLTLATAHPMRSADPAEGTLWVRSLEVWNGVP